MKQQIILSNRLRNINICDDNITTQDYCYISKHDYCNILLPKIYEYIDCKKNIPEKLIERFFKVIGHSIECWSLNYNQNLKIVEHIINNYKLTDGILIDLILRSNSEIQHLFFEKYKYIDKKLFNHIINILNYYNDIGNLYDILIEYSIKVYDEDNINILFDYGNKRKDINVLNKLLDSKFKPPVNKFFVLIGYLKKKDDPINIIKKCVLNGIQIKKNFIDLYVDYICKNVNYYERIDSFYDIIIYFYDNGATDINIFNILNCIDKIDKKIIENTINYIIENNYDVTKKDFLLLCKHNIQVKNIKKIQNYLDDTDIQALIFNSDLTYPVKIKFTLDILKTECKKKNNLKKIQQVCKSIIPDELCLEYACSVPNNNTVIKYLHEIHKIPFNDICIINFASTVKQNQLLRYILTKYKKDNNIDINNNIKFVNKLDNKDNVSDDETNSDNSSINFL